MQYFDNQILIRITLAVCGGAGVAGLPLLKELMVETTYPADGPISTGFLAWLTGPLGGALIALSSLISHSDPDEYPESVCREGEIKDLSCFFPILIGKLGVYYPIFLYFYRKFNQFLCHIRLL